MSNISFSHCVFYPFVERSTIITKFEIVVCKVFQFGRVQNLLFRERLPFPKGQILDPSNFKDFADNFKFDENSRKFAKQVENTAGKGEIAREQPVQLSLLS